MVAAERQAVDHPRRRHARQRADPLKRFRDESPLRVAVRVPYPRQRNRRRQNPLRVEARIDRQHAPEARKQQTGADEQDERKGDLGHDQRPAQRPRAESARTGAPLFAEHRRGIRRHRARNRNEAEHDPDRRRDRKRVGDDGAVEPNLVSAWQLLDVQRTECVERPVADEHAGRGGDERHDQAFRDELPGDAHAPRAEREPRRKLLQPHAGAHEHEVRDVDAADQEHAQRAAPHEIQRRFHITHERVLQPPGVGPESGIDQDLFVLRKAFEIRRVQRVELRLRLLKRRTRLQPPDVLIVVAVPHGLLLRGSGRPRFAIARAHG